jgi:ubiquinone/menaquinone biosynthesis C-methylase UbiE
MMDDKFQKTENRVRDFYNQKGWSASASGDSKDAELWEDLRPCAEAYVRACRLKLLRYLPESGDRILDAASGPIQYAEYLTYSEGFQKRVCVDISQSALAQAKNRIGERGEFVEASLLNLPFEPSSFDAALSLHTIYHIQKETQEKAVRELIRVTKAGAPIVIVYANPKKLLSRIKNLFVPTPEENAGPIYYFAHPLEWWKRFEDEADLEQHCWRSLTAQDAKRLIPNNPFGRVMHWLVLTWENLFDAWATRWGAYPVVVLRKRSRDR